MSTLHLLHNYPPEILNEIFQDLSISDLVELSKDHFFEPYYLRRKYERIRLQHGLSLSSFQSSQMDTPYVRSLVMPHFVANNRWFQPKSIEFAGIYDLLATPIECLSKLKNIDQVEHGSYLTLEQFSKVSKVDGFRTLNIKFRGTSSLPSFKPGLLRLRLQNFNCVSPIPQQFRALDFDGGSISSLSFLPTHLRKLELSNVNSVDFNIPLPSTLSELSIQKINIERVLDIRYLQHLKKLKIDGDFQSFELPHSIESLECDNMTSDQVIDISFLSRLESAKMSRCHKCSWIFPRGLLNISFYRCDLNDIISLEHLPLLDSVELKSCALRSPLTLDIIYPASVTSLKLAALHFSSYYVAENSLYAPNDGLRQFAIFGFRNLSVSLGCFELDMHYQQDYTFPINAHLPRLSMLDSNILWPESLKSVSVSGVLGFFGTGSKDNNDLDSESMKFAHSDYRYYGREYFPTQYFRSLHWMESFDTRKRSDSEATSHRGPHSEIYTEIDESVWPSGLKSLTLVNFGWSLILNMRMSNFLSLSHLDLGENVYVKGEIPPQTSVNLRSSLRIKDTMQDPLPLNIRKLSLFNVQLELTNRWLNSIPNVSVLAIDKCALTILDKIELSQKVVDLAIVKCRMTSDQLQQLTWHRTLKKLDFSKNQLDSFDVSLITEHTEAVFLHKNRVHADRIPSWGKIVPGRTSLCWRLVAYVKIEELGGAYTACSGQDSITALFLKDKLVVFEGEKCTDIPLSAH